jgi:hypothetical protein
MSGEAMDETVRRSLEALHERVTRELGRLDESPSTLQVGGVIKTSRAIEDLMKAVARAICQHARIEPDAWVAGCGDRNTWSMERASLGLLRAHLPALLRAQQGTHPGYARIVSSLERSGGELRAFQLIRNPQAHASEAMDVGGLRVALRGVERLVSEVLSEQLPAGGGKVGRR